MKSTDDRPTDRPTLPGPPTRQPRRHTSLSILSSLNSSARTPRNYSRRMHAGGVVWRHCGGQWRPVEEAAFQTALSPCGTHNQFLETPTRALCCPAQRGAVAVVEGSRAGRRGMQPRPLARRPALSPPQRRISVFFAVPGRQAGPRVELGRLLILHRGVHPRGGVACLHACEAASCIMCVSQHQV